MDTKTLIFFEMILSTCNYKRSIDEYLLEAWYDSMIYSSIVRDNVVDIGGGAGFPSVIYAINNPNSKVTMVEQNLNQVEFVKRVISRIGLDNLTVEQDINMCKQNYYDLVISRMLGSMTQFVSLAGPLLNEKGVAVTLDVFYDNDILLENELPISVKVIGEPNSPLRRKMFWMTKNDFLHF